MEPIYYIIILGLAAVLLALGHRILEKVEDDWNKAIDRAAFVHEYKREEKSARGAA